MDGGSREIAVGSREVTGEMGELAGEPAGLSRRDSQKLAGGANHRSTRKRTKAPAGAKECLAATHPPPLPGRLFFYGADPVAASANGGLADRLISRCPSGTKGTSRPSLRGWPAGNPSHQPGGYRREK